MSRIPTNHRLYAAALLRAALIDAGIEVRGPVARVGAAARTVKDSEQGRAAGGAPVRAADRHHPQHQQGLEQRVGGAPAGDRRRRAVRRRGHHRQGPARPARGDGRAGPAARGLRAHQRIGPGPHQPPDRRRHGRAAAEAVHRPALGPRAAAVAVGGRRRRHHPQPLPQLAGGRAGAGQDRHPERQVVPVRATWATARRCWCSRSWSRARRAAASAPAPSAPPR